MHTHRHSYRHTTSTHAHSRTLIHTQGHHAHSRTLIQRALTRPCTHTFIHSDTHAHSRTLIYTHARGHSRTCIHVDAYAHLRTFIHMGTHAHRQAHTPSHAHTRSRPGVTAGSRAAQALGLGPRPPAPLSPCASSQGRLTRPLQLTLAIPWGCSALPWTLRAPPPHRRPEDRLPPLTPVRAPSAPRSSRYPHVTVPPPILQGRLASRVSPVTRPPEPCPASTPVLEPSAAPGAWLDSAQLHPSAVWPTPGGAPGALRLARAAPLMAQASLWLQPG